MILTYRYRVKSLNGKLNRYARMVNFVWNYSNDCQKHALKWNKKWPGYFDLCKATSGAGPIMGLSANTVSHVCKQYVQSRTQKKRPYLRYRGNKSLGWIPVKGYDLKRRGNAFRYYRDTFLVWSSRPLPEGKIKDGTNFSQDARGNWYLNIVIEVTEVPERPVKNAVGIDLGLKDFAALSTGEVIENPRNFRVLEQKLATAQRARKKRQAKKIHAKIANRRRDHLHKLSHRLTNEFDHVVVGGVSSSALKKTKLAKSVSDAGWYTLKQMLAYKAIRTGARYEEVNEAYSTRTCSACGCISGPKGQQGLNERVWSCSECGTLHDRDVNAAVNILRLGQEPPAQGVAA